MNKPSRKTKANPSSRDDRRTGAPESVQSNETSPPRTQPPEEVGLADERRPGLGTRGDDASAAEPVQTGQVVGKERTEPQTVAQRQRSGREPNDRPLPRDPREQQPDGWDHEEERSTGVSGHMSGQ